MNPNTDLQLVPETLLKKRHDLDLLQARRAAASLSHSVSRKRISNKAKVVKIVKPQTILVQSRQRKNAARRYNRVSKKGMQTRASNGSVVRTKVWDSVREEEADATELPEERTATGEGDAGEPDADADEGADAAADAESARAHLHRIPYRANSVGAATVFAVLLRPTIHTTPKPVRRTLSALRLRRVREGVFLPYDAATRKMLHLVEPYVLYGVPGPETVADLVRRRGFGRVDGQRVPLADNNVIERELGDQGLICVEDLVQTIAGGGADVGAEVYGKATKFLWPFRLTARKSKFQKKMLDLKDGKLYGDQGEAMNGFIREML